MDRVDGNGSQLKGFVDECRGRSEGEACAESPCCGSWTVWIRKGSRGSRDRSMNAVEGARGKHALKVGVVDDGPWTVWMVMGMGHGSRDSSMNAVEGARGKHALKVGVVDRGPYGWEWGWVATQGIHR